jgi:hypothetical protein
MSLYAPSLALSRAQTTLALQTAAMWFPPLNFALSQNSLPQHPEKAFRGLEKSVVCASLS